VTFLYVTAAIVALLWVTLFVVRGSLVGGCLAFLIAGACFGYYFLSFDLGPIPLTIDRLVLAILLAMFVIHWRRGQLGAGPLGTGPLGTGPLGTGPLERVDVLLLVFIVLLTVSTILNLSPGAMPDLAKPWTRLLGAYVIPAVLYFIARGAPTGRRGISLFQGTLVCLGVYLAATGLLEITQQWWAVFPKHITDPDSGIHFGRARGPMVQAVSYGSYVGVCLLAAWVWQWRFDNKGRLLLMALLPLLAAAAFFTYTRSAWLGIALGMTIVLGLTLRGVWRPLVLGTIVSVGLLLAVTKMDKLIEFDRGENVAHARSSVDLRGDFAYLSWKMFLDRPLLGVGFDQFRNAKLPYLADRSSEFKMEYLRHYSHHNTLLSLLTETGLVGLSLFLAVLGGWGWIAWKLARSREMPDWARAQGALLLGALGIYISQAAFHELSYTAIDNVLIFTLAGLTVGLHAELTGKTPSGNTPAVETNGTA